MSVSKARTRPIPGLSRPRPLKPTHYQDVIAINAAQFELQLRDIRDALVIGFVQVR